VHRQDVGQRHGDIQVIIIEEIGDGKISRPAGRRGLDFFAPASLRAELFATYTGGMSGESAASAPGRQREPAGPDLPPDGRRTRRWGLAVLLLVYLALYARTAGFDFVWDDSSNFAQSPLMHGPLRDVIRKGEHARSDPAFERMPKDLVPKHESFRPVSTFSHWLDLRLFGERPGPMHWHSVLLGVLSVFLVFLLAGRLGMGLWLPGLWAPHPLHTETFPSLSARSDLLAAILSLVALVLAVQSTDGHRMRARWLWAIAASLSYLLSLFAKETNLGLPLAVLAMALIRRKTRAAGPSLVALLVAALAYFPLRSVLMQATSLPMAQPTAMWRSLMECPGVVLAYLVGFAAPYSLTPDHAFWSGFVPLGWATLALAGLALALWRRIPTASRPHLRVAGLALAALAPLLLPAALGVRSIGALSDRYVFFPFFFVCVAVVALGRVVADRLPSLPHALRSGPAYLWVVMIVAVTWFQVGVWKNEESLARHAVAIEPDSSAALYRLATVATVKGQFPEALPLLERAVALDGGNQRALNNLAVTYLNLNRVTDAKAVLRKLAPLAGATDKRFWYNVASVQLADGKLDKVCSALGRALEIDPGYQMALAMREQACSRTNSTRGQFAGPAANPGEASRP
jgi:protein O-mannosyl-transferase